MKITLLEPLSISKKYLDNFEKRINERGHEFVYYDQRTEDEQELINRIDDSEVIILTNIPLSQNILKECSELKMISVAFTGVDHIDLETCRRQDIMVCNSSGYANQAVAELTFGLMISLMRKIKQCDRAVRKGETKEGLIGNEIAGKKMGIIGTGEIGLKVAELGQAFGCDLLGYDRVERAEAQLYGLDYLKLEELVSESDIITVHLPLTEETEKLIDEDKIKKFKSEAIFINAARGPIVDYEALAAALRDEKLAGAGIDVFYQEPPLDEDNELLELSNTILTPHIGFATQEAFNKRAEIVFNNIFVWEKGELQNKMI